MKDKTALYILFQPVDESGFKKIVEATTSKEVWESLEKVCKGVDQVKQVRLQTLRGELKAMKMNATEGVSDYITCVQTVPRMYKEMNMEEKETNKEEKEITVDVVSIVVEAVEEAMIMVDIFIPMIVIIVASRATMQEAADYRLPKRVKENTNHEPKKEKVDGIVMMAYEEEALMAYKDVIGVKVKEEGGDVKMVNRRMKVKDKGGDITSYERGKASKSWSNQIDVDMDVDEYMRENKENGDDEDPLYSRKMLSLELLNKLKLKPRDKDGTYLSLK
nr:retrovirus-related Pol polyprotein from transposon TNT 1-94 [Tanacetum cinerariifolium]